MVIAMVHMDPANLSQDFNIYYVHTCEFISQREVSEGIAIDITVGGRGISLTASQLSYVHIRFFIDFLLVAIAQ